MAQDPKKDSAKAPKVKVDTSTNDAQTSTASTSSEPSSTKQSSTHQASDAREQGAQARKAVSDATKSASSWLDGVFPGHGNAVLFAIIGLVAALLLFSIGFWQTLVIIILVVAGVAFGQYLDGDPKIMDALKGFFGSKR